MQIVHFSIAKNVPLYCVSYGLIIKQKNRPLVADDFDLSSILQAEIWSNHRLLLSLWLIEKQKLVIMNQ